MPVMQGERGVVAMFHRAARIDCGVADAALPAPSVGIGCVREYLFIFGLAHTVRMLLTDEDAFTSRAEDFGNHVRLARSTADRLVFQDEPGIHLQTGRRHEEPLALTEERTVVTEGPLSLAESGVIRRVAHGIRL